MNKIILKVKHELLLQVSSDISHAFSLSTVQKCTYQYCPQVWRKDRYEDFLQLL